MRGRPPLNPKKRQFPAETLEPPKKVGLSSANMVVNALVKLWQFQGINQNSKESHPRGDLVKMKLESLKKEEQEMKFNNFSDRGEGTAESIPSVFFIFCNIS